MQVCLNCKMQSGHNHTILIPFSYCFNQMMKSFNVDKKGTYMTQNLFLKMVVFLLYVCLHLLNYFYVFLVLKKNC